MATTRDERHPVSWEDLLAVINPPQKTPEELYELALDEIMTAWREGHLSNEEADALINELLSARMQYELREVFNAVFANPEGGRRDDSANRRLSLI